jgi:hypothetical protein
MEKFFDHTNSVKAGIIKMRRSKDITKIIGRFYEIFRVCILQMPNGMLYKRVIRQLADCYEKPMPITKGFNLYSLKNPTFAHFKNHAVT